MHRDDCSAVEYSDGMTISAIIPKKLGKHSVDMPLLTEFEQQQLKAWNATEQSYPRDVCVQQLVAKQVAITPDTVALVMGNQTLNYRELNNRANRLANYLRILGVQPNVLVGLCVERSLDMVVGLLGILKAGGAYVPLDPTYPLERLAFMLEDSQAPVLIAQSQMVERLAVQGIKVVSLDTDAILLSQQRETEPPPFATTDDLAYVIYTSGSTGQPKGVQITHNSLLNLVFWHQRTFAVTHADRATQVASPAFDATGWELWPYLTIGASVYLPEEDTRANPVLLRDWLVSRGITITFLPTVLAESIMALEWPSATSLRFLLTGADALHHYPPTDLPFALINNYGPTEATVVATSGLVPPISHAQMPPAIGRPIANTQAYILDENLQHVPIGAVGELYIGGEGLARGYLNRPELTDEKFVTNPFSTEPGAHLYKTGDLVRYLEEGQIAFIGRVDQQVKIRGYRIELGEIEAVLNQHPAVQQAVVTVREDVPGEKCLVAYIVTDSQMPVVTDEAPEVFSEEAPFVSVAELQGFLQVQLPDYMVPATFILIETLPITPNGKVDRAALPAPDIMNTIRDAVVVAPSTPTEERVLKIVTELLGMEQVRIVDNFFMLGGHSLLGTQVIARVSEAFGVNLALRTLFEAPTVQLLSTEVEHLIIARVEAMSEEEVRQLLKQGNKA